MKALSFDAAKQTENNITTRQTETLVDGQIFQRVVIAMLLWYNIGTRTKKERTQTNEKEKLIH